MDVEVRVPATVANLGPGFDCLGAAVGAHLLVRFAPAEAFEVVAREPLQPIPGNLTYRAYAAAFEAAGRRATPVRIEVVEAYASARGMGASASAIVAGLVAGREVGDLDLTLAELARLAVDIEGHPDNVLPALFGGVMLCSGRGWMRFEPTPAIAPLVLVAREKFRTSEARRAVPGQVPIQDAVANAARVGALVAVLAGLEPPEALLMATEDRLHEPYRLPLMGETLELHRRLRERGIAAALAGAGPSLVCLVESPAIGDAARVAEELVPGGWHVLTPGWDLAGAQVR